MIAMRPFACLLLLAACGGDELAPPPPESPDEEPEVRELVISEAPAGEGDTPLFGGTNGTIEDALARLSAVERDENAKGLFLRVGVLSGAWGRVGDLAAGLARIRAAGKPVHCHFDFTDNLGYYLLATSCDRISMTPAGDLELVGVAAHLFYAKRLLDNIGVRADLLQVGRFKGAADPFTEEEMPESTRESMNALLDDLMATLVTGIARGRDVAPDRARAIIDEGPFDARDALAQGLVDDVAFEDEAREHIRKEAGVERVRAVTLRPQIENPGLGEILAMLSGEPPEPPPDGDRLALVHVEGNIVDGEEQASGAAVSGPFVAEMKRLRDDDAVKAVVVRIDSPGGSALASDRMWHALRLLAQAKPVVVSVGDMAASGGFYIASAADEIVAHESSLVGSIGVVAGKVAADELARDIGLNVEIMSRGRRAAWTTPTRAFTDEERAILGRMMQRTYDRFIQRIVTGREMEQAAVEAGAEGRILSGGRALRLGLVDRIGGLEDAIERARELGGLHEHAPIERWPAPRNPFQVLAEQLGGARSPTRVLLDDLARELGPLGQGAIRIPELLERERVLVALPFALVIE
jgi:protease-4